MSDVKFISGLTFKAPHEKAPSYIMARGSIKREDLIAWLGTEQGEWINFDVKVSQNGKWYAAVDEWKPNQAGGTTSRQGGQPQRERPQRATDNRVENEFQDDDIPFISQRGNY